VEHEIVNMVGRWSQSQSASQASQVFNVHINAEKSDNSKKPTRSDLYVLWQTEKTNVVLQATFFRQCFAVDYRHC
jgi:hypothetical protein